MRTIAGLFDSWAQADSAIAELERSGFSRSDMSVVGPSDATRPRRLSSEEPGSAAGAGTAIGAGLGLLAGLSIVAVPGIGALAALGPILAGGVVGALAGGLVGSLVDAGLPEHEAVQYAEGVRRGGTLVTVATSNDDAARAIEIIARHDPVDLEERALLWRESGWSPGAIGSNQPDPAGATTMGDAAAAMPDLEDRPAQSG